MSETNKNAVSTPDAAPVCPEAAIAAEALRAKRRRLLISAGVALPSVLTLTSGASVAYASTLVARFTSTTDQYYRLPVYEGKTKGNIVHCVNTPQTSCTDAAAKDATDSSIWIANDGTRMVAGPYSQVNVSGGKKAYGLVYIDKKGTIATLDPNGNPDLFYATTAAVESIMGANFSKLG